MHVNKRIEYKQKITLELEKEVVAFLNSNEGGVIYVGIDKIGKIVGVENPDEEQLLLKYRFKHNILSSCMGLFDIVLEEKDRKNILKIIVAGGYEKPYYVKKNYGLSEKVAFIPIGNSVECQIEKLFSKITRNSIRKIKSPKQDLYFQQLQIYYQSTGKLLNEQFAKNLELLTEDNQYNYVACLLNDVNGISVKLAKYSGLDQVYLTEDKKYVYESLIKATKQVLDKLNLENRTLTQINSKEHKEKKLWNPVALREAIINAFVQNDYKREITPKFEIFRDRLVITSYGGLPEGLSQEEFFEGVPFQGIKNLRIYRDLELVEQIRFRCAENFTNIFKRTFQVFGKFLTDYFTSRGRDCIYRPSYPAS